MANVLNSNIIVSEFKLQSCKYIHFKTNTKEKGMNHLFPTIYALNSTTTVLLQEQLLQMTLNKVIIIISRW